uniref:Uncharacterized protein n=1 Tax=Peronospora matthiolae TaxID=2874970 RepID=A0AAV1UDG7_9STRA
MDRPGHLTEDEALSVFLGIEEVDDSSASSNAIQGDKQSEPDAPVRERIPRPANNSFPKRGAATAPTALGEMHNMDPSIISNPLDEEQQRILDQVESARRKLEILTTLQRNREYTFTPPDVVECIRQTAGRTLAGWDTGPEA